MFCSYKAINVYNLVYSKFRNMFLEFFNLMLDPNCAKVKDQEDPQEACSAS